MAQRNCCGRLAPSTLFTLLLIPLIVSRGLGIPLDNQTNVEMKENQTSAGEDKTARQLNTVDSYLENYERSGLMQQNGDQQQDNSFVNLDGDQNLSCESAKAKSQELESSARSYNSESYQRCPSGGLTPYSSYNQPQRYSSSDCSHNYAKPYPPSRPHQQCKMEQGHKKI